MPNDILPEIQKVAVAWGEALNWPVYDTHKLAMDIQEAVRVIVEEKESQVVEFGNSALCFEMDLHNAKIEIERLKKLIECAYEFGWNQLQSLEDFKKENGL